MMQPGVTKQVAAEWHSNLQFRGKYWTGESQMLTGTNVAYKQAHSSQWAEHQKEGRLASNGCSSFVGNKVNPQTTQNGVEAANELLAPDERSSFSKPTQQWSLEAWGLRGGQRVGRLWGDFLHGGGSALGMLGTVWAAGPLAAAVPSEGETRVHMTPRERPCFRGGSFCALCSVKSRDVLHTQGTQATRAG